MVYDIFIKFIFFVRSFFVFVLYPIMLPLGNSDSAFTQRGAKPRLTEQYLECNAYPKYLNFWNFYLITTKGIVFFSRKRLGGTHSLTLGNFCFYFFRVLEKKKQAVFFFPGKVCMPLTQLRDGQPPKKGQKR